MDIRFRNRDEAGQRLATELRAMPEVGAVLTVTDLLPPMDERMRAALAGIHQARRPDFERFATLPTQANDLVPALDGIAETVGRIGFNLQLAGHTGAVAADTAIPDRLSSHSDGWQTWVEITTSSSSRPGTTSSP